MAPTMSGTPDVSGQPEVVVDAGLHKRAGIPATDYGRHKTSA
jgi:hypothetical protein